MNILFFVGNGFDIALHANTRYIDFYNEVVAKLDSNNEIYKSIKSDTKTQADFERKLCLEYINDINTETKKQKFLNDYYDFKDSFSRYLSIQNERVLVNINKYHSEYTEVMKNSIYYPSKNLKGHAFKKLSEYFNKMNEKQFHRDFILFNYTSLFKTLMSQINNIEAQNIIQIHGTYTSNMIMGFFDEGLLLNKDLLNNREIANGIIKKRHIETVDEILLDDIFNLINLAGIYVIVGMSIGESDSIWWDAIVKGAIKNKTMILYIGHCPEEYLNLKSNRLDQYRNGIINKLIAHSDLNDEEEYIRENTIVDVSNMNFRFPNH